MLNSARLRDGGMSRFSQKRAAFTALKMRRGVEASRGHGGSISRRISYENNGSREFKL